VVASVVVAILMSGFAAAFLYVPLKWTAFIAGLEAMGLFSFGMVGLGALLLPFRRPDIWQLSPYRWMIGKVPVIALLGLATIGIEAWMIYYLVTNAALGANTPATLRLLPSLLIIGLVWFAVAQLLAKRRGMSLIAGQRELPPE
jgi:hypothetical protein